MSADQNIVELAVSAGNFQTLARALQAASLVDTLRGPGPFTVFAPPDAAFAKLPSGALDDLLAKPDELQNVLLLHVVDGELTSSDLARMSHVTTMAGINLPVQARKGRITVGGATVTSPDLRASNGIIHVIDSVLLPKP